MKIWGHTHAGRIRFKCLGCDTSTTNSGESSRKLGYDEILISTNHKRLVARIKTGQKRFVVTSAQNNTRRNSKFFASLKTYCKSNKAELICIPVHYKNISLYTANQEYKKQWPVDLQEYMIDAPLKIGGKLIIRADVRIASTTLNPLTGKGPINGRNWTVFGHPQFAMETVASPIGAMPKRMYTTGSITVANYTETNLGARAKFHHVYGALIIEVARGHCFVRQLNADSTGGFYDLDYYYPPSGNPKKSKNIAVLTPGDEHIKFNKKLIRQATYDKHDSIVKTLRPTTIVRHDVLDGYAGSHHHERDDVTLFRKYHKKDHDYRYELDEVVDFINQTTPNYAHNIIVASNHNEHLTRWLSYVDPKKDHQNALLIHELKTAQYENALADLPTDPLRIYLTPRVKHPIIFLNRKSQCVINGVDYAQHGDYGINGARGSARGLAGTTYKMVIGHSHGAMIVRGVYQVGSSTGVLEYEKGFGCRSNTHCIQYANGKRTLIDIFGSRWRL